LKAAIETLGVTVTVTKDSDRPFYTIIFTGPGGANVNQLEVVESTLERTVKEALETQLDTAITAPGDFQGYTLEITRGEAKNKFRVIIGGSDPEGDSPDSGLTTLIISRPWEGGLTEEVPSLAGFSEYTIEKTNPNLLVDENEETDFFFLNDTDNVTSIGELPTAELIVTADHLSGLGMGGEQLIGGRLLVPGGIQYTGLEELIINLGSGDNRIIIHDTQRGATTINAGEGSDVFFVENVSGHTFLNGQADADTVNVSNAGLLSGITAHRNLGAIFGMLHGREYWYGPYMPIYFIASAIMSRSAAIIFFTWLGYKVNDEKMDKPMERALEVVGKLCALMISVLVFFYAWKLITGTVGAPGKYEAIKAMLSGPYAVNFWVFEVLLGMVEAVEKAGARFAVPMQSTYPTSPAQTR